MNEKGVEKEGFFRDLVYFPITTNVVGLPIIFLL